MIKLENNLCFFRNYFSGVQDLTNNEILAGMFKTASYFTVIIPIIFGIGYLHSKIKHDQFLNFNAKIISTFKPNFTGPQPTQKDLIKFLVARVQDQNSESFTAAFNKLKPSSQGDFFSQTIAKGKINDAIHLTPKNINRLQINFGESLHNCFQFGKTTSDLIEDFFKTREFKNLDKMVVDLRGVAPYTENVSNFIRNTFKKHSHFNVDKGYFYSFKHPNEYDSVINAINGISKYFEEVESLKKVEIKFYNGGAEASIILVRKNHKSSPYAPYIKIKEYVSQHVKMGPPSWP